MAISTLGEDDSPIGHLPGGALPNLIASRAPDVVQTAVNFAPVELMTLAELGFTTLAEVGAFVASGGTEPDGAPPTDRYSGMPACQSVATLSRHG